MPRCDLATPPAASPSAASAFRLAAIRRGGLVIRWWRRSATDARRETGCQPRKQGSKGIGLGKRGVGRAAGSSSGRFRRGRIDALLGAARDQAAPGRVPASLLEATRREPLRIEEVGRWGVGWAYGGESGA